jgi:ABC-type uncharacterized transport system auxiliary subunit
MKNCIKKHLMKCVVIFVFSLVMACSMGKIQVKNYYIISYTPNSVIPAASKRPHPFSIQIGRFEVQRIFNRQNILFRYSSHQIQYYEFQHWAVRPDYMLTDMVFKHLEASKLANRVGLDFFDTRPDFRVEGVVEALEKLDARDMFFAHLAMSFKMLRIDDGSQVWEYTVRGLSSILHAQMDVVISQLDSLFLTMEEGPPQETAPFEVSPEEPAKIESSSDDLDESAFEIIPEQKMNRDEEK